MTSKAKMTESTTGRIGGIITGCLLLTARVIAADSEFAGRWHLTIDAPGVVPYVAQLDIEEHDGDAHAWVENGPAPVDIDGKGITLRIDARDRQGFRFVRVLKGELEGDRVSGTLRTEGILETAAEFGEDGSPWSAVRAETVHERDSSGYTLSDFAGTWVGIRGRDLRKFTMDLTESARDWVAAYDARMDEPQKRCVSPGLVAATTWIFPFELLVNDNGARLTMIYEAFGLHRRIFMNQTAMPEFYPESSMGYSLGRFAGGELLIETALLSASTRDFNGEPVSENTRIVERYFLSNDGNRLNLVMHMHDPDNYNRPPIRRRAWDRDDDALIFPFECDPDSFYRQLFEEGRMQEYIDRSHMRP
jgi:hypothetical protein